MEIDNDRIDEAILALLYLGLHDKVRIWKSFDWDAMALPTKCHASAGARVSRRNNRSQVSSRAVRSVQSAP